MNATVPGREISLAMPDIKDPPIGVGAQAEVFAWGDGQVLKLFLERDPISHELERLTTRAAAEAGLPVPAVIGRMIEVGDREGIVFERIDGPTMGQYARDHPDQAVKCGNQMAELHAALHREEVPVLMESRLMLTLRISLAEGLSEEVRDQVLEILDSLPGGGALCHNDFHPLNIIMAGDGPVIIDWSGGGRGNPLADHARSWVLFHSFWSHPVGRKAGEAYLNRYRELRPFQEEELANWLIVSTASSLASATLPDPATRIDFVNAMLEGRTHPWIT